MATVTERRESGEGNADGVSGDRATRLFNVFLDQSQQDASTGLYDVRTNPIAPIAARYSRGMQHPNNQFLFVSDYAQPKMLDMDGTTAHWIVEVLYATALSVTGTAVPGWTVEFDVPMGMEEVTRDLDGKWIGGHAYKAPIDPLTSPADGVFSIAKTVNGDAVVIQMALEDAISPRPLKRPTSETTIRLSRDVAVLSSEAWNRAEELVGSANSDSFLTGAKGQILAAGVKMRTKPGSVRDTESGLLFHVEAYFRKRKRGWEKERLYDTYEIDGFLGSVVDNVSGEPIFSDFRLVELANLSELLHVLSGGEPAPLPSPVRPTNAPRRQPGSPKP